jgi:hypothetical protein
VEIRTRTHVDPDVGLGDLVGRLTDDSKRLLRDEVRLAKMEVTDSLKTGSRGLLWLAIAFGVGTIAMVALTILLTTAIARIPGLDVWSGALITGVLELAVGLWLIFDGVKRLGKPPYTLEATRSELKDTAAWIGNPREHANGVVVRAD